MIEPNGLRRKPSSFVADTLRGWAQLRHTPYGLLPASLVIGLLILAVIPRVIADIAGPNIAQDLNLDLAVVGGIVAVVQSLSVVASLYFAWLADRVSRVRLVVAASIAVGVGGILTARAPNANAYATGQTTSQVGNDLGAIPQLSLLADYYPVEYRGRFFSLFAMVALGSKGIIPLLAGALVAAAGWRSTVFWTSAPLIFFAILAAIVLREPVRGYFDRLAMGLSEEQARTEVPPVSFGEGWRAIWRVRTMRRLFVADLFSNAGRVPINAFQYFLLANVYGLGVTQRTWVISVALVAAMVGSVVGGSALDQLALRAPTQLLRVIAIIGGVGAVPLALLAALPPLPVVILLLALDQFLQFLTNPAGNYINTRIIPPHIRSQGLQVTSTLIALPGSIALGLVFAPIVQAYGFGAMILCTLPLLAIGIVVRYSAADFFEPDMRNAQLHLAAAEEEAEKLLVCRGVGVFYEQNQVLFGVDFDVTEGEIVALLGTNGAGKSTLLRAISGTQEASDGAIRFDGRDITHMPPHEIAARGVVHMPGGRGVFPGLSVEENLLLATWLVSSSGGDQRAALQQAYEVFPVLRERRHQHASLLSGGEQQMLSLAQAFMARPKLLMIDELSLGLSPAVVGELLETVREINRRGTTVIVVEQSVNVALTIAQRAVFMEKGEVKFAGPTADLLRRPDILRAVYVKGTAAAAAPADIPQESRRRLREHELSQALPVLEAKGIAKRFGGVVALAGVDLQLREGEILGIVGPNGSGKTTLFDILSGYQKPDGGSILLNGKDVTALGPEERARAGLVRRFQDARLFPGLTVMETLLVALDQRIESRDLATAALALPNMRRAERRARARAERLVELLDLGAYRDKFVRELSTGLRRIVDLAWVLATQPKVLLLDEPSSGIAQAEAESLGPLLGRVRHETGCSILLIEHDIPLITAVSDELVAMAEGRVLLRGRAQDVLDDPRVVEAFLGTSEEAVRRQGSLA